MKQTIIYVLIIVALYHVFFNRKVFTSLLKETNQGASNFVNAITEGRF